MVTRQDYNEQMVQAAHAVLLELVHVLGEYRDGIALVGGWVPALLPQDSDRHVGSMDVDIALDHMLLEEPGYETICRKLEKRGYRSSEEQPFIIMKAMAMADREKEKDPYDIYYVLRHFPGGLDKLIKLFHPHIENGLVREGLRKMAEKFTSPNHIGPNFVADFEGVEDKEERELLTRDVFERVNYLLRNLELEKGK